MSRELEIVIDGYVTRRAARFRRGLPIVSLLLAGSLALLLVDKTWGILLSAIFGLFLAAMVAQRLRLRSEPGAKTLRARHREVVWVYYSTDTWQNGGIMFGLRSGEQLGLPNAEEWMLKDLIHVLPNATFGYSPERLAQFRSNPAALAA